MIRIDPASAEFERLTKKEQALIYYFDIGWDLPAIAEELDTNVKGIERWLDGDIRQAGKPRACRKNRVRTPEECEREFAEVCRLFRQGTSPMDIIEAVKLSRSTVYRVLKDRFGSLRHPETKAAA